MSLILLLTPFTSDIVVNAATEVKNESFEQDALLSTNSFEQLKEEFKNTQYIDFVDEVHTLVGLNIMNGYDDGTFLPLNNISRAEFTKIITELLALNKVQGSQLFADVPSNHWASESIQIAYHMGIISGFPDGNFRPDDPVTYNQMIKMLVSVLGYDKVADLRGGYPSGYLAIAFEQNLLKNVNVQGLDMNTPAQRGNTALMVYNTLNADVISQAEYGKISKYEIIKDIGILGLNKNIFKGNGVVTGNSTTLLGNPDTNINENKVEIDGIEYQDSNNIATKYLGYYIIYYYKEDTNTGKRSIVYARLDKKNDKITLNHKQIKRFDDFELVYTEDEDSTRDERLKISSRTKVIYNGKSLETINYERLLSMHNPNSAYDFPFSGEITWIDNSGDGIGDVLFVESPLIYVVKNYNNNEKLLMDTYEKPNVEVNVDSSNQQIIIEKDGVKSSISEIKTGDVLTIYQSVNTIGKRLVRIEYTNENVTGVVSEISDEKVTIGAKEYELAPEYVKAADDISSVKSVGLGTEGIFKLDTFGRIAGFETITKSGGIQLGILIDYGNSGSGLSQTMAFKIFSQDGEMIEKEIANKVKVDGVSVLYNNAEGLGNAIGVELKNTLIRYGIDSTGKINFIDTKNNNAGNDDDVLNNVLTSYRARTWINSRVFYNKYGLVANPIIFRTPVDSHLNGEKSAYSVIQLSELPNAYFFKCDAYKTNSEAMLVDTLVIKYPYEDASNSRVINNMFMIEKITDVIDEEGVRTKQMTGLFNGQPKTFIVSPNRIQSLPIIDSLKAGTIINPRVDAQDKISEIRQILFNPDALNIPAAIITKSNTQNVADSTGDVLFRLLYGKAIDIEDGMLIFSQGEAGDKPKEIFNIIKVPPIFIYNEQRQRFENGDVGDLIGSKIFMRVDYTSPVLIIIYK